LHAAGRLSIFTEDCFSSGGAVETNFDKVSLIGPQLQLQLQLQLQIVVSRVFLGSKHNISVFRVKRKS
jgi:hypothetical protein